jgi:hypothetical protein
MTAHKRTEITVETDRVLIVRRRRSTRASCPECGREVDMAGPEDAEALSQEEGTKDRGNSGTRFKAEET